MKLAPMLVGAARLVLGAMFVYLGIVKALDPVGFLKLVRDFGVLTSPPGLNLVATLLPWFEVWCGGLLLLGVKVRATALVQFVLLAGFTVLIFLRARALHEAGHRPFCAIRFDCGCGTGEVLVCLKLFENLALMALAAVVGLAGGAESPSRAAGNQPA